MGRIRFRGRDRDRVRSMFWTIMLIQDQQKNVDPGTCLTWQNHGNRQTYTSQS